MTLNLLDLYFYDYYQVLLSLLILLLGGYICLLFSRDKIDIINITLLYIWHTFFSVYYWKYTTSNSSDAVGYFKKSFSLAPDFSPGTGFTQSLAYIVTSILNSNYLNTTLVFNIFGAIGISLLYLAIKPFMTSINKLWVLILFIPSMSFWSAGLGKDSIAFMATCLFLYGITEARIPRLTMFFSFLAMFMVRPHIAAVMLVSFTIYFILKAKTHIIFKVLTIPIILIGSMITLQFVQQYVGLGDLSVEGLDEYVNKRQGYNLEGGSSLDIASMSYPMQMFTYIFRPLPFEAHSIVALITSIENTILLLLFLYISFKSKFNLRILLEDKNLWLFTYAFLTCTVLALTTANLGIATRQKWMFMPVVLYLLIYAYHDYSIKNNRAYV